MLRNAQAKPQATPTDHSDHGCPWLFIHGERYGKTGLGSHSKLFLAEYAKTKISPKEWCEANGYNYATARRHIKIPAQGKEKKRRKMRSAQDAQIPENPAPVTPGVSAAGGDDEGKGKESPSLLKPQHEQFAQNIAQGMPQKEAAICAGYAPTNAESQASILMSRPDVKARVQELRNNAALLVSFNAGHRRSCRINLRSWRWRIKNLVRLLRT